MSTEPRVDEVSKRVEQLVGYRFSDPALLLEALTHRSHHNENPGDEGHNERLEFLGDAVLDLVVAESLMRLHPFAEEGRLTKLRASMVNEASLARVAGDLDLGSVIRLGKGEEKNNGREKPSILSDAVEAILGAIYLDGGFDAAREAVGTWFADVLGRGGFSIGADAKSTLQEILQASGKGTGSYRVVEMSGPDHEKVFRVEVAVDDEVLGSGEGRSKKEAEKAAARDALERVKGDSES